MPDALCASNHAGSRGAPLAWVWALIVGTSQQFPPDRRNQAYLITGGSALPPALMTARAAEVLKVRSTYHFAYQAAFKHEFAERPLLIRASTLVPEVTNDPLASYALKAVGLIPGATLAANDRQERAQAILDFLDL